MNPPHPPVARREPERRERYGIVWSDEYAWLRDPAYPEVRDPTIRSYLEAENAYFEAVMAPHRPLVEQLHAELKGRIKEDDHSVPAPWGPFAYQWRFEPGAQYRAWFRQPLEGDEAQLVLDENELAKDKAYFRLASFEPTHDGRLLAYASDEDGSERYRVHVTLTGANEALPDLITNCSGSVEWAEDGESFLYVELNEQLRPFRVRLHRLGSDPAADPILYEEADPAFFVSIGKTQSRRFLKVATGTHVTRELRLLDAADPSGPLRLVAARRTDHRYSLDHANGRFFILTNDRHENYRLVTAPESNPSESEWEEVIAGSDRHYLLGLTCFADFMAIAERADGLSHVRIRTYAGEEHTVPFEEPAYTVGLGENREFETDLLRLTYTSMVTPASVFDYEVETRELHLRKRQEIPSGYDPGLYTSRRLLAPASDGTEVPITIVYRKGSLPEGGGPLLLYGYGAYGHGLDPAFASGRLSLLDRGVAFAYAHVRGGDELGWRWYREGKLDQKKRTFADFITCAEYLIREGYTKPGEIAIRGGSAGGMLIGAVLNKRPELWRCAVLDVPFVDVLATMLDASLPLTPIEWPEWGNPVTDPEAFCRILTYSPYDNIKEQAYPPILITAGISDPRVTYWEPAKYAARLRAMRTDDGLLLLKTNMTAGHFGKSGRYEALYEAAEALAFVLVHFGKGGTASEEPRLTPAAS
jgi:oligopeptidase B